MSKTRIRSFFIMIRAWQAHQNLSIISESTVFCEGQVSRAKDFFLVFGHPEVFGKDGGERPSGKLRKRLSEVK
jgi:hypothetical protein